MYKRMTLVLDVDDGQLTVPVLGAWQSHARFQWLTYFCSCAIPCGDVFNLRNMHTASGVRRNESLLTYKMGLRQAISAKPDRLSVVSL